MSLTTNGNIEIMSGNGPCEVVADIEVRTPSQQESKVLLDQISVRIENHDGIVKTVAERPKDIHNKFICVNYMVTLPSNIKLRLNSVNGAVKVSSIKGAITIHTVNGSIRADDIGGDVKADTNNGEIYLNYNPTACVKIIHASTVNGSVSANIPKSFAGSIRLHIVNGFIQNEIPFTVQSKSGNDIDAVIGSGGDDRLSLNVANGTIKLSYAQ